MAGYRPVLGSGIANIAAALPEHAAFFFDRVAPGTLALARYSREAGALVVFEPSGIKDEALFVECLKVSHILKYSHERLSGLDALVRRGRIPLEIQTRGADGLQFRLRQDAGRSAWVSLDALPPAFIRDAAGSGDWCTAGLIWKLLHANSGTLPRLKLNAVVAALRFGQALAALNCSYDGARGLMYAVSRSEAMQATDRLLEKKPPRLPVASTEEASDVINGKSCTVCSSDPVHYNA
jgi:fructokinase